MLRFLIHLLAAFQFGFGVYYDWNFVKIPFEVNRIHGIFGKQLKFLTFWDANLQTLYFALCLINDIYGSNDINSPSKIRRLKNYIFSAIAFPVAMFVGLTFWGLMAIDRELVFPKFLDVYFPSWLNHVMHTNIMIFALIEMFLSPRKYPKRSQGLFGLLLFMAIYLVWIHVIYYNINEWVYPILNVLNGVQRIGFFAATLLFGVLLYFIGEFINNKIWGKKLVAPQTKQSKRKKN